MVARPPLLPPCRGLPPRLFSSNDGSSVPLADESCRVRSSICVPVSRRVALIFPRLAFFTRALLRGEDAVAVPGAAALDAVVAAGADRAVVGGVADARGAAWLVSGGDVTQIDPPAPYDDVELRTDVPVVEGLVALDDLLPEAPSVRKAGRLRTKWTFT